MWRGPGFWIWKLCRASLICKDADVRIVFNYHLDRFVSMAIGCFLDGVRLVDPKRFRDVGRNL